MKIKIALSCVILLLGVGGCSPTKRLNKLIKKHPELLEARIDSITVPADTIEISTVNNIQYNNDGLDSLILSLIDSLGHPINTETISYVKTIRETIKETVFLDSNYVWEDSNFLIAMEIKNGKIQSVKATSKEKTIFKEYHEVINNEPTWMDNIISIWPLILTAIGLYILKRFGKNIPLIGNFL